MPTPSQPKRSVPWVAIVGVLVLYASTYYALVDRSYYWYTHNASVYRTPSACYSLGGKTAEVVFQPMWYIDRFLRPEYWAVRVGKLL